MERLTFEGNFCDIAQCRELPCKYDGSCTQKEVWERLQDYEDSGLAPAEVHSMSGEWCAMMSVLNSIGSYDRLRELAEADKDGRVLILPCKVGDTVYRVITIGGEAPVMLETKIKTLGQAADVAQFIEKKHKVINVFLTREEAEKALQEMEGKT